MSVPKPFLNQSPAHCLRNGSDYEHVLALLKNSVLHFMNYCAFETLFTECESINLSFILHVLSLDCHCLLLKVSHFLFGQNILPFLNAF